MHVIYLVRRGRRYHTDQSHRILFSLLFFASCREGRHFDLSPIAVQCDWRIFAEQRLIGLNSVLPEPLFSIANWTRVCGWQAVVRWLEAPRYPGRFDEKTLSEILSHIRFAMMTADQLCELERSSIVERYASLFVGHIHGAYKYHSLSLAARAAMRDFHGPTFLLRNYTETRWDKRLIIHNYSSYSRCSEVRHA